MIRTALTMLVGDRSKFLGVVSGLAFASLLITQQGGIFVGVMALVYGHATDTPQAEIWVSDRGLLDFNISDVLHERELDNVRSVSGVRWAVPLLRWLVFTRDSRDDISPVVVMGIDDATLIGGPVPEALLSGSVADLSQPDTVIVDAYGAETKLRVALPGGGSRGLTVGDPLDMNGHRFRVAGMCRSTLALTPYPTVYMRRSLLSTLIQNSNSAFNFILVGTETGVDHHAVCKRIDAATGLAARTTKDFSTRIYDYYLYKTGIPANFAVAVLLGFVVGAAIAGQTFSQYVNDNRRIFASLKAMGMRNRGLMYILLIQASFSALLGLGIGTGGAVIFAWFVDSTSLSFSLHPTLLLISFVAVLMISLAAALFSLRSLLRLDPALVFRS